MKGPGPLARAPAVCCCGGAQISRPHEGTVGTASVCEAHICNELSRARADFQALLVAGHRCGSPELHCKDRLGTSGIGHFGVGPQPQAQQRTDKQGFDLGCWL